MKKNIFPFVIVLFSILFMVSCESDEPFSSKDNSSSEVNTWIYKDIFEPNYLWNVTESLDYSLAPEAFFNSLKNTEDKVSSMTPTTSTSSTSYNLGFTYAANKYTDNTYYVIYYIHTNPPSNVEANLKRGYIITSVNGTKVTSSNSATLLENATQTGKDVELTYIIPPISNKSYTITISPTITTEQNPIYATNTITRGSHRVGYILYNQFLPGQEYKYDDQLAQQFNNFQTSNIDYLILDLRYNGGGALSSSAVLASAMVKDRDIKNNLILYVRSRTSGGSDIDPITFIDRTGSGTEIPKLGDQLKGIYIITGKYTAGASLAFINAIQAYTATPITIAGEEAVIEAGSYPTIARGGSTNHGYTIDLALAFMANKNGQYNYASGITIENENIITDVSTTESEMLYPLGSEEENVLYEVLNKIANLRSISTARQNVSSPAMYSPLTKTPWYNKSTINLDDLNK